MPDRKGPAFQVVQQAVDVPAAIRHEIAGQLSAGHTIIVRGPSLEVFVFELVILIAQAAPVPDLARPEIGPQPLTEVPAPGVIFGVLMTVAAVLGSFAFWGALLGGYVPIPEALDEPPPGPDRLSDGPDLAADEPEILSVPIPGAGLAAEDGEGMSAATNGGGEASRSPLPPAALLLAIGWTGVMLLLKLAGGKPAPSHDLTASRLIVGVIAEIGFQLLVFVILFAAVVSGPGGVPWRTRSFRRELRLGLIACLAAIGPVMTAMFAVKSLWPDEEEHFFLQMLRQADSGPLIALIILSAGIVAPLSEELTYRVTLQGGTERYLGRGLALVGSAVLFSVVHGFPDMVALLPLAIILGWIYQRTRSYVAIVTAHAAFNLFNLAVVLVQTWWT